MLVATRDPEPRADGRDFAASAPHRSTVSRLTGMVQLLGSIIGIPLALASGYSIYHSNFSPEARCQALRTSIVAIIDRNADASMLRTLAHRDIVAFERDCGTVDPEAVAAFSTLLAAERTAPVRATEPQPKNATAAPPPAAAAKVEPAKVETAAKPAAPPAKPEPTRKTQAAAPPKRERERAVQESRPVQGVKPTQEARPVQEAKPAQEAKPVQDAKPAQEEKRPAEESRPAESSVARSDSEAVDAAWLASVREALRESASRPAEAPELAAPITVPPQAVPPDVASPLEQNSPPARTVDHPVPPAPIPNVEAGAQPGG